MILRLVGVYLGALEGGFNLVRLPGGINEVGR